MRDQIKNKNKKKTKTEVNVLILLLLNKNEINIKLLNTIIGIQELLYQDHYKFNIKIVPNNINEINKLLYENTIKSKEYSHILFIKDDLYFDPIYILNMIKKQENIVAAVPPHNINKNGEIIHDIDIDLNDITDYIDENTIKPKSIGFGLILFKSNIFRKLVNKNPDMITEENECNILTAQSNISPINNFFIKLSNININIICDLSMKLYKNKFQLILLY